LKNINRVSLLFCLLFVTLFSAGLFLAQNTFAGASNNVSGFAWSGMNVGEEIGSISFNATNCGACSGVDCTSSGLSGCPTPAGKPYKDYGVNIDPVSGEMSGYAWSESLGWIMFDKTDLTGCPGGTCEAKVSTTPVSGKYAVTGWARVKSVKDESTNNGGWEGWIHLSTKDCDTIGGDGISDISSAICPGVGKPVYNVYIDSAGDFHGFAWTDMVLGWMSFNSANTAGSFPYKVHTSVSFALPVPVAAIGCDSLGCIGGTCGDPMVMYAPPEDCANCVLKVTNASTGTVNCTKLVLDAGTLDSTTLYDPASGIWSLPLAISGVATGSHTLTLTVSNTAYNLATNPGCAAA
jgi:hypothetical protein